MTDEVLTPEQEEAAFDQGFNAAVQAPATPETKEVKDESPEQKAERLRDEQGRYAKSEDKSKAEAKPEAKSAAKQEEKPAAPLAEAKPAWAGVSEDDWKAVSSKASKVDQLETRLRQFEGLNGELKRSLTTLQEKLGQGSVTPRQFTAQVLKRVHADFPDLAESLAQDLSEAFAQTAAAEKKADEQAKPFDSEAFFAEKIAPAFTEFEARAKEREEMRIVKSVHRDFDQVVKSPEFAAWLGTQTPERQKEIRESDDGYVAADAVTQFKESAAKAKKQTEAKKSRLETALTPQGDGGPSGPVIKDDEALFEQGFKEAGRSYAR